MLTGRRVAVRSSPEGTVLIFALAASVLYGTADFLGGVSARRAKPVAVSALTMPAGAVVIAAVLLIGKIIGWHSDLFAIGGGWRAIGWAAAAGAAGVSGLVAFYAGFAGAAMSVVAPVSALVSTVLPVGVAVAGGERPGGWVIAGAAACVVAIVLVSASSDGPAAVSRAERRLRGLAYGIASGVAFGLFFLFLRNAGHAAVLWPITVQRAAGGVLAVLAVLAARARVPWRDRTLLRIALLSGGLDALANVAYVLAARGGQFGLAVVITSLYPGMTVLLARVLLRERLRAVQQVGLVLAAAGIVLVTA